jgi:hypothetical protein
MELYTRIEGLEHNLQTSKAVWTRVPMQRRNDATFGEYFYALKIPFVPHSPLQESVWLL